MPRLLVFSHPIDAVSITLPVLLIATTPPLALAQEDYEDIVVGHYRKIDSQVLDEDRTLLVNLPRGYESTTIAYPVLYILYGGQVRNYFPEALEYMPRLEEVLSVRRPAQFAWRLDVIEENGDFLAPTGLREGLTLVFSGYGFPAAAGAASLAEIEKYYAGLSEHYGYEVAIPDMVLAMQSDNLTQRGRVDEAIELLQRQRP